MKGYTPKYLLAIGLPRIKVVVAEEYYRVESLLLLIIAQTNPEDLDPLVADWYKEVNEE